ncbi:MAG TPA: SRPBCC family protein [Burkholderiaceae bacterium]|nr:SRPBCC family protein [Burkholderiaceae bacterium]
MNEADSPATSWLQPQPLETASTLPAHCYVDAAFAARERAAVFARSWQLVAFSAQVSEPGDHVIADIAGVPLLVVRGDDGALRALHNVCRHRAGPLATCDGRARTLTCKYHGWTYALDGRLLGAPDMGRARDFDVAAYALPRVPLAEWGGLVFAALTGDGVPFERLVDGVEPPPALVFERRAVYELACNWKVYVENYLEGYHVRQVHPALSALLDADAYETRVGSLWVLQTSPLARTDELYGPGFARYVWLWPNTMLNVLPGRLQTNRVLPIDAQRCRVVFDYYYSAHAAAEFRAADMDFSDAVQREDIAICEAVQRGLASGSYASGRLNPHQEQGIWRFQELLRAAYRSG